MASYRCGFELARVRKLPLTLPKARGGGGTLPKFGYRGAAEGLKS